MEQFSLDRRTVLRGIAAAGGFTVLPGRTDAAPADAAETTDPHTRATFAAAVDAIVPETPELAAELGPEHRPGALAIGVHDYMITYVNTLFSAGSPVTTEPNLRLAELIALLLDAAATELIARGEATPDPAAFERLLDAIEVEFDADAHVGPDANPEVHLDASYDADTTAVAGLTFARLAPEDRLRALAMFDGRELDTAELPGPMVESDLGLVPTLVVGFTEVIYYSEWQGYDDLTAPPSEREHPNDPAAVQSWRQTDYPGVADGYAAYRGYWGGPDSSLGDGAVWRSHRFEAGSPRQLTFESGEFRDNEYDTSDYEEATGDGQGPVEDVVDGVTRTDSETEAGSIPGRSTRPTGPTDSPLGGSE